MIVAVKRVDVHDVGANFGQGDDIAHHLADIEAVLHRPAIVDEVVAAAHLRRQRIVQVGDDFHAARGMDIDEIGRDADGGKQTLGFHHAIHIFGEFVPSQDRGGIIAKANTS